jgi:hypothetical protein
MVILNPNFTKDMTPNKTKMTTVTKNFEDTKQIEKWLHNLKAPKSVRFSVTVITDEGTENTGKLKMKFSDLDLTDSGLFSEIEDPSSWVENQRKPRQISVD